MKRDTAKAMIGLLLTGTFITMTAKLIYSIRSQGIVEEHTFRKPWFQTFFMFLGMIFCFPLHRWKRKEEEDNDAAAESAPLLDRPPHVRRERLPSNIYLAIIPAANDILATGLMLSGLMYVTVSVSQLLRGSELIFCTIFSVTILRRRLDYDNWVGVLLCIAGVSLVALANIFEEDLEQEWRDHMFGFLLILASQAIQAFQVVVEEYLLQGLRLDPLELVAYEGVFGTVMCLFIALPTVYLIPGRDAGSLENTLDSLVMVKNNSLLVFIEILDTFGCLLFNFFGMCITHHLSAMHRTVLEALRTLFVWFLDVVLYYVVTSGRVGEPWTASTWIQLLGFLVIICGTVFYNWSAYSDDPASSVPPTSPTHSRLSFLRTSPSTTPPPCIPISGATPGPFQGRPPRVWAVPQSQSSSYSPKGSVRPGNDTVTKPSPTDDDVAPLPSDSDSSYVAGRYRRQHRSRDTPQRARESESEGGSDSEAGRGRGRPQAQGRPDRGAAGKAPTGHVAGANQNVVVGRKANANAPANPNVSVQANLQLNLQAAALPAIVEFPGAPNGVHVTLPYPTKATRGVTRSSPTPVTSRGGDLSYPSSTVTSREHSAEPSHEPAFPFPDSLNALRGRLVTSEAMMVPALYRYDSLTNPTSSPRSSQSRNIYSSSLKRLTSYSPR